MTTVLAIESVKGGVSKSTTTAYLGEALARDGRKILVVDADPQGTLLEWEAAAAETGRPFGVRVEGMPSAVLLRRRLAGIAAGYDAVLIDCPNRDVGIIEAALELADLAIVPVPPGVEELRRARAGLALATGAQVPARLLVTLVDSRASLARQVLEVLDEEGLPRFTTVVRRRADIANTVGASRPALLHDYAYVAAELEKKESLVPREATRAALLRTKQPADKVAPAFSPGLSTSAEKGRITVDLGPELYRRFKAATAWDGRKMNDIVRELVSSWVDAHPIDA